MQMDATKNLTNQKSFNKRRKKERGRERKPRKEQREVLNCQCPSSHTNVPIRAEKKRRELDIEKEKSIGRKIIP